MKPGMQSRPGRAAALLFAGTFALGMPAYAEVPRSFKTAQATGGPLLKDSVSKQAERLIQPALKKQLDDVLATKNYAAIAAALAKAPPIPRFAWLMSTFQAGKTVFLAYPLLRELSSLTQLRGSQSGQTSALVETADTAVGVVALYAVQVHLIDGAMCQDASAPGARLSQFLRAFQPIFQSLKAKPAEEKVKLIQASLQNEKKTRLARQGDDFLCRGGLAEYQAAAEQLGKDVTVGDLAAKYGEKRQTGVGTTVRLPPVQYVPKFLPPQAYWQKQHELRMNMVSTLVELLK